MLGEVITEYISVILRAAFSYGHGIQILSKLHMSKKLEKNQKKNSYHFDLPEGGQKEYLNDRKHLKNCHEPPIWIACALGGCGAIEVDGQ